MSNKLRPKHPINNLYRKLIVMTSRRSQKPRGPVSALCTYILVCRLITHQLCNAIRLPPRLVLYLLPRTGPEDRCLRSANKSPVRVVSSTTRVRLKINYGGVAEKTFGERDKTVVALSIRRNAASTGLSICFARVKAQPTALDYLQPELKGSY